MNTTDQIRPVIVIPAHARAGSLLRLLKSINASHVPSDGVRLIVSVDGTMHPEVADAARKFEFNGVEKEVVVHEHHLGLRKHIIWCGELSRQYGSVIVLEDDLVVDPWFYQYAIRSLDYYADCEQIAGIALYSQRYNDHAELPFIPLNNGYSTFFMQVGCSLGQVWSQQQWAGFYAWYQRANQDTLDSNQGLPENVKRWPESSWKKYFNAYIVDCGKYIVYPYDSYTTNSSDSPGVHIREVNNVFQTVLRYPARQEDVLRFAPFDALEVAYDGFMEPCGGIIYRHLGLQSDQVEIDIHGHKPWELLARKPYVLTTRVLQAKEVRRYPLSYKPVEMNLLYPVMMEDAVSIRLYEMNADVAEANVSPAAYFNMTRYFSDFDSRNLKYARGYIREFVKNLFSFYLDHRK